MIIIAGNFVELIGAVQDLGLSFRDMSRSPFRFKGRWICEVRA